MLILERQKSSQLLYYQALLRRIYEHDVEYEDFHKQLLSLEAGHSGEQRTDREFIDIALTHPHTLLYNLELLNAQGTSHQIDSILVTPNFLLILEIKNMNGTLFYNATHHEFGRIRHNGQVDIFSDPFAQSHRHQTVLERLLHHWGFMLPVMYVVVVANSNVRFDQSLQHYPILQLSGLRLYIERLFEKYSIEYVNTTELEKLSTYLLSTLHRPAVKRFVAPERLQKGVLCAKCQFTEVMVYVNRTWYCPKCGERNKKAVHQALHDYRLLISDRITNKEFRDFVGIESMQVASKILSRLGYEKIGDKRGRVYIISEDCL
ncbi:nuclease-related domain-containing protein [Lysinibacillus sp. KU-BSD001]|uniref:nuclease-related domain-containing protein n=1 Tax=Lysinibacillus sp. KU-BSD001 TaxID=3141328 RepID=UPI0036E5A93B